MNPFALTFKHMSQVPPALTTDHLRSRNHQLVVRLQGHRRGRNRLIETRPSRTAVVFGIGNKEGMPTSGTTKGSLIRLSVLFDGDLVQDRGSGGFGSLLSENIVLVRRQKLLPFLVRLLNGKAGAVFGCSILGHMLGRSMGSLICCKALDSGKAVHRIKHAAE